MTAAASGPILLDASAGARAQKSGIGRYVFELVSALTKLPETPALQLGVRLAKRKGRKFLPDLGRKVRLIDDRLDRLLLRGVSVFHGLDARITPYRGVPRVATIHDLFSRQREDLAEDRFRRKKRARYQQIAEEADVILCVSAATEQALLEAYPAARGRTLVVHHGVAAEFRPVDASKQRQLREVLNLTRPYFLFVGLLSTRKNLMALLQAFDQVASHDREVELVLAGARGHGFEAISASLESLRSRDRVRLLDFVAQEHLPTLYSTAEAFVFPSLAEGFGLPILEALACGTAVVASDLPVHLEVGGAELRAMSGVEDLVAQLLDLRIKPPSLAERRRGQRWARQFTWERAARQTLAAYTIAANRHGR
jgi:glycosyltransferase involved in cell wall biosynthesis